MRSAWKALLLVLSLSCGRTDLVDALDAGRVADSGIADAGAAEAGAAADAGQERCPQARDAGWVVGRSPLGPLDLRFVWVGSEPPGSHSCPHVTVQASDRAPGTPGGAVLAIDFFAASADGGVSLGKASLSVGTQTVEAHAIGVMARADGLVGAGRVEEAWRTQLSFQVSDGGWDVHGVVDALECPGSTWRCL